MEEADSSVLGFIQVGFSQNSKGFLEILPVPGAAEGLPTAGVPRATLPGAPREVCQLRDAGTACTAVVYLSCAGECLGTAPTVSGSSKGPGVHGHLSTL